MSIKPIETEYNDDLFRSRLEARWAVFFKTLGIEYKYEPEGFDMDGIRYLPDFWLPNFEGGLWVEVKPTPIIPDDELYKIIKFVNLKQARLFLLVGDLEFSPEGNGFLFSPQVEKWIIAEGDFRGQQVYSAIAWFGQWYGPNVVNITPHLVKGSFKIEGDEMGQLLRMALTESPPIKQAYLTARQYRFGKNGRG